MKRILFLAMVILRSLTINAQTTKPLVPPVYEPDHVSWAFTCLKVEPGIYTVHVQAQIEKNWTLYSQFQYTKHWCEPTMFAFLFNPLITVTKIEELGYKKTYTDFYFLDLGYENYVDFQIKVIVKNRKDNVLKGDIIYQTCDMEGYPNVKCVDRKIKEFQVALK